MTARASIVRTVIIAAILSLVVIGGGPAQAAGGGRITGKVIDAASKAPLAGVSIVTEGPATATTRSDSNGNFALKGLIPGSYIAIASLDGYEIAQTPQITVSEGMEQTITISLAVAVAATPSPAAVATPAIPPMDFGNPPSGEVPILFNDHHVYANPAAMHQNRVLAAVEMDGTLMVPLRSMFEQMGATVSYDDASKSVHATKPGSDVQVTLGKNEVVINGESRPLDVPPVMYKGVLLVPVRVISEALGAYVQWMPDQHLAVVRYNAPTPVPTSPPTPASSVSSTTAMGPRLSIPPPLFTYAGDVRAFYFGRTNGNSCLKCKPTGSPDALAFNSGGTLHGQINVPHSPWVLGATYFGSYPFGANWPGPLNNIGYNPLVDNTLPGYSTSVWGELYAQYKTAGVFGQTGREELTNVESPWAHTSDSRIEPASFQGTLLNGNIGSNLNIGGMYMVRFRSRVTSAFNANTLLTSCNTAFNTGKGPVEGVSGTFTVPGDPCNKLAKSQGFLQFDAMYKFGNSGLVANAYQYEIYDIATMTWLNAQWNFAKQSVFNPYFGGQFLAENNTGVHLVGTVHDYTYGGIFGATIYHNLNFTAAYDGSPATAFITASKNCGTSASPKSAGPGAIFGGVADTTNKAVPPGDVVCYGGGIASPYTDSYATDTLYTTSITQGMADTHLPGTGVKAALAWQTNNRQLRMIASQAWYNYGLPGYSGTTSNGDARAEFNFDVQYFFNKVRPGPYRGLSIRQRYADRTQPFTPYDFKYSRTQLEYTF